MITNLFNNLDLDENSIRILKNVFESYNLSGHFMEYINYVVDKNGVGDEYSGCMFPSEVNKVDDEYFDKGVLCWYLNDEIIVSEQEFHDVMLMACQRYIELNPNTKEEVKKILNV